MQNSVTGKNSGCMRWFAYAEDGDTFTMILDHNSSNALPAWVSKEDYSDDENYGEYGNNDKGPLTLLNQLKTDTSGWSDKLVTPESYDPTKSGGTEQQKVSYSGYKARLISAEEIAEITKNDRLILGSNSEEDSWTIAGYPFVFDKRIYECVMDEECDIQEITSKHWWLFENLGTLGGSESCEDYGCKKGQASDPYGYWTASPRASTFSHAWRVDYNGALGYYDIVNANGFGVRPVVTVSKSNLQ